jgi:phytoene/squalene synthetase
MRQHVAALYAFARAADDFADEGDVPAAERLRLLDAWQQRLHEAVQSPSPGPPPLPGEPSETQNIFLAVGDSIRSLSLPVKYFEALLSAFRQDVTVTRYRTWDQMMEYCQRSANPVGRLVLRIAGYDDRILDAASDALCAALQLTNFWQDLKVRFRSRAHLPPQDERDRHDARETDLAAGNITDGWQRALSTAAGAHQAAVRRRAVCLRRCPRSTSLRASSDMARRRPHPRSPRTWRLRRHSPAADAAARRCAAHCTARRGMAADPGAVMSRDTSFYYSFLVLPPRKRSAIVAVWDFCRAVDDAVDEAPDGTDRARAVVGVARRARGAVQTGRGRHAPSKPARCSHISLNSTCRSGRSTT